jgi:hypothetical protein
LRFTCLHSLFLPWFSTHLTLPFIKTLKSWLFHITKICTLEYIVINSGHKITIHFIIFWYYRKLTQQYEHRICWKSLCFSVLLKTWIKIIIECLVLLKWNQNNKSDLWYIKTKFVVFYYKIPIAPPILPKLCLKIILLFPRSSPFRQSQVTSSWFKTNKNSKFKITMFHE